MERLAKLLVPNGGAGPPAIPWGGTLLKADGRPYWLRSPPTPPLLRPGGFRRSVKDRATLDLFGETENPT